MNCSAEEGKGRTFPAGKKAMTGADVAGLQNRYIDAPSVIINSITGEELNIFEKSDCIPVMYYALVSEGTACFASMPGRFDQAADMLAEDENDDAYIGLIVNGECTRIWTRADTGSKAAADRHLNIKDHTNMHI